MKLKTHVLMVSRVYPKGHWREGAKTFFENKIERGEKIHTIRSIGKWPERIKEVQEGKALLSVREWTGEPYNSPQKELFQFTDMDGVGYQVCERRKHGVFIGKKNDRNYNGITSHKLAENDGLKIEDFESWFRAVKPGTEMIIIHFTKFRYV